MISFSDRRDLTPAQILPLYRANGWSAAHKPEALCQALLNSHTLISAWDDEQLVGIGNAISDGYLVVYYPHLLVLPDYQGRGIGRGIMARLQVPYLGFHMQMLVADGEAIAFYEKCGFVRAGQTEPMWIYAGDDH
ncbi:MAG: GNAT family N-acetyltransferase [Cyanobacteria bacterium P01_A01_bin.135]